MVAQSTSTSSESIVNLPSNPLGYIALLAAVVTGGIHLLLGPRVIGFSQLMGVLFILNGVGFLAGSGLYLTKYWRPKLYLVAAGYAAVTLIALFGFQGFSLDAFYMQGDLNPMAVLAKTAELVLTICAVYLYTTESP
jgi:hypothetical protein